MSDEEKLSKIKDIAKYLNLSESKVYELAQKGEIPAIRIGGAWRFKSDDISKWLDKNKQGKPEKPEGK